LSACQVAWLDTLILELKIKQENAVILMVDKNLPLILAKHSVSFFERTTDKGEVDIAAMQHNTGVQIAAVVTKPRSTED
jgi:hypothetical protein